MRIRRRKLVAAISAAVVLVLVGGFIAWRLAGGDGDIQGSTTGFIATDTTADVPTESWPEYGHDAARTRANTNLTGIRPPYRRLWTHDARSLMEFPPVIVDNRVIGGANDGHTFALDLRSGRTLWRTELDGFIASSPAVWDDVAYFTTTKGRIVALRADTGERIWVRKIGRASESSPLVIGNAIYVGTLDGEVMRLDTRTGRTIWTAKAAGDVKSSLAESGPNVIATDYAGEVRAFAKADGRLVWRRESPGERFKGPGRFYAGPAVAHGRVFVGNINNRIVALQADTGKVAWVRSADDYVYSSAAVAKRTVFVGSYDHKLYALDAVTGQPRWTFDTGERISGSATVIGDIVYVSTLAPKGQVGATFGLEVTSGKRVWTFPDGRYTSAVAVDDTLVIVGREKLYGFTPR